MKKTIKIILGLIALTIVIIFLLMYKSTFASFIAKIAGKGSSTVAEPIFIMENTEKMQLNDNNTEINYYFNIKNFDENSNRSQTDLKYIIEISPIMDKSIIFNLYKDDKVITLNNQKTDYIDLSKDLDEIHKYRLNVKYDRESTNLTDDIKDNIFIKADAIQK